MDGSCQLKSLMVLYYFKSPSDETYFSFEPFPNNFVSFIFLSIFSTVILCTEYFSFCHVHLNATLGMALTSYIYKKKKKTNITKQAFGKHMKSTEGRSHSVVSVTIPTANSIF